MRTQEALAFDHSLGSQFSVSDMKVLASILDDYWRIFYERSLNKPWNNQYIKYWDIMRLERAEGKRHHLSILQHYLRVARLSHNSIFDMVKEPLREMPIYINSEFKIERSVAKWRLAISK